MAKTTQWSQSIGEVFIGISFLGGSMTGGCRHGQGHRYVVVLVRSACALPHNLPSETHEPDPPVAVLWPPNG